MTTHQSHDASAEWDTFNELYFRHIFAHSLFTTADACTCASCVAVFVIIIIFLMWINEVLIFFYLFVDAKHFDDWFFSGVTTKWVFMYNVCG